MNVDVTQILRELDGTPLGAEGQVCPTCGRPVSETGTMTLRDIACRALTSVQRGEQLEGKEQVERYELARKIYNQAEVELTAQQVAKIQTLIAKVYGPLVTGQAWRMLEGEQENDKPAKEPGI